MRVPLSEVMAINKVRNLLIHHKHLHDLQALIWMNKKFTLVIIQNERDDVKKYTG